jgi:hypothetical protein
MAVPGPKGEEMTARRWQKLLILVVSCFAVGASVLTGCGSEKKVSANSLKPRLIPTSLTPGFHVQRTLDWSDPVDLVIEGTFLPQMTHPSAAVKEVRGKGFRGAVGQELNQGGPRGAEIRNGIIKFKSDDGAAKFRDWMHRQDLQQPCIAECIFSPRNLAIPGVPNAAAVRQSPVKTAPPDVPTRYLVEFTAGPYLYFFWGEAGAKDVSKFVRGAAAYYNRVKGLGTN